MTVEHFRGVIWHLANGGWCRYWLDWDRDQKFRTMAFQVRELDGKPAQIRDATRYGFEEIENYTYKINRTNEDGSQYESKWL